MNAKSNLIFKTIKSYTIITIGLFINAISWNAFLIPSKIVGGGVTGLATLIYFATDIPIFISYLVINAILILLAIKILGKSFGIKTVYAILVLSFFFSILPQFISQPIVNDRFMAAIIGGILGGVGIGIVFTQGGSSGGTDIIALMINKYRNISPGRILLVCDIVIIASSYFLFKSLETIVYGYVTMGVFSYVIDLVLVGSKQSVQIFIFSKNNQQIAERISNEIGRGVTIIKGQGWYTKVDTDILMVIARKYESQNIFKTVKEIDPDAFISLSNAMGVYGKGFDNIK
ncbi:MAG: membrane protein [Bacteroidetes bacterium CG2_30_32_10]|nr:MAG: membrane protein [Bacteroidetes bacterium CG2_30_32_10]